MNRRARIEDAFRKYLPHARGDEPTVGSYQTVINLYSPRTWGWAGESICLVSIWAICPTHVGMNRMFRGKSCFGYGILHARGDEPDWAKVRIWAGRYSPRKWG